VFATGGSLKRNLLGLGLRFSLKLARKYYKQKNWDKTEYYFKKCLSLDVSHTESNLRLGQIYRNRGDKQKSIPHFEAALSFLPQDTLYAVAASYELGRIEQSTQAIQFLEKFLKQYPDNLDALRVLTAYFLESSDFARCIETSEKAIALGDKEQSTYLCLGDACKQVGQIELARKYYRCAAESYPQSWFALTKWGAELQNELNLEAENVLQRSLSLKFDQPDAHNNLGLIYLAQNKIYASIPHFRQAQILESANPISYINLAKAYTDAGRLGRAQLVYDKGKKIIGDDPKINSFLRSAYLYFLNYIPNMSLTRITHEHEAWGQHFTDKNCNKEFINDTQRNRPLKIGYISPDLRKHSVFYFFSPIVTNHDSQNFKIFCYANNIGAIRQNQYLNVSYMNSGELNQTKSEYKPFPD